MKNANRPLQPETRSALQTIGAAIAAARKENRWTIAELAERLGVSPALIRRIENGESGTAIGSVFEAAVICGVPLFDVTSENLPALAARTQDRLQLLPSRIRYRKVEVSDDF